MVSVTRSPLLLFLAAFGLVLSFPILAEIPTVDESELTPSPAQKQATRLITRLMTKHHYRKVPLEDALSAKILENYLRALDPNRVYFVKSDIEGFQVYEKRLDDFLRYARLEPAFEIFLAFRNRLQDRMTYAVSLLDRGFNFNIDEEYETDRSEAQFPKDRKEWNEIWRKRVKNDALNLRLASKDDEEIKDALRERYEGEARRTRQLTRWDVYQVFMNAYTDSVGPYTSYFAPLTRENFKRSMSLSTEGIGVAMQAEGEHIIVEKIIAGSPADKSRALHIGDRIVGVGQGDGPIIDVVGWRLDDVVGLVQGRKGTTLRLRVESAHGGLTRVVSMTRDTVTLDEQAARGSVMEVTVNGKKKRVGLIELHTFYMDFAARARGDSDYRSATHDVRRLLAELTEQGIDGIVIDVRGNSGGSLAEAIEFSGLFIESGPIVQVKSSKGKIDIEKDSDADIAYGGPLVVLVDRHSAGATEILAAAMRDYGRAIIVGEPTYGMGTVATLVNLDRYARDADDHLGQLKLAIAHFFRVNGDAIEHRGVLPDIIYPTAFDMEENGEGALDNALPEEHVAPVAIHTDRAIAPDVDKLTLLHEERVQNDAGFNWLLERARIKQEGQSSDNVTLLESQRRLERRLGEQALLASKNQYRAVKGLSPLDDSLTRSATSNTLATEQELDYNRPLQEEAVRILADYVAQSRH